MKLTRYLGLFYIVASLAFFYLYFKFPANLTDSAKLISIILPLISWLLLIILGASIPFVNLRYVRISENWILPQMILFVIVGITNYAIVYSLNGITDGATDCTGKLIANYNLIDSLYFSMVTWTTLGYGDFQPLTATRFVAASEAMLGYFSVGLIVGAFFESISKNS